jgi:hypothetical protein
VKEPKHPRLTPLRALDLLQALCLARRADEQHKAYALDRAIGELDHHVKAALVSRRRKVAP